MGECKRYKSQDEIDKYWKRRVAIQNNPDGKPI
jgi:hypothetical protein